MNKKTKFALLIGAVAAVVSAVVLLIVFWDKLLSLCPCKKEEAWIDEEEAVEEEAPAEEAEAPAEETEEAPVYSEEECNDFADLEPTAE